MANAVSLPLRSRQVSRIRVGPSARAVRSLGAAGAAGADVQATSALQAEAPVLLAARTGWVWGVWALPVRSIKPARFGGTPATRAQPPPPLLRQRAKAVSLLL